MTPGFLAGIEKLQIQLCSSVSLADLTLLPFLFARCSSYVETLSLDSDFDNTLRMYCTMSIDTREDEVEERILQAPMNLAIHTKIYVEVEMTS